jgi:hypothetical protein
MPRKPAVAGSFYAGTPESLRNQVLKCLETDQKPEEAMAAIVPHAGYMYSGWVAGAVYSRLKIPKTVVILGPNHTGMGAGASIMVKGEWQTPLGGVAVNEKLAASILNYSKVLADDEGAHLREHSLEVQLPFLQYLEAEFSFVPIAFLSHNYEACEDVGKALSQAIREYQQPVLILASTDMSHYVSQEVAKKKDQQAINAILNLSARELYQTVLSQRISMCGFIPTVTLLIACQHLGAKEAKLVKYMTSGDINRDYTAVVGYAGFIIR